MRRVPPATVERLPLYLQCLEELPEDRERVSSEELAAQAGLNPATVRKDLSYLGSHGVRGVGYEAEGLRFQLRRVLGLTDCCGVVVVGAGNLGRALAGYGGFPESGFRIAAVLDTDPGRIGTRVGDVVVEPVDRLDEAVRERDAAIGVIAVPAAAAQEVADLLAGAGIASILNFAPAVVRVPDDVVVRQVDLSTELQVLSFYLQTGRRSA